MLSASEASVLQVSANRAYWVNTASVLVRLVLYFGPTIGDTWPMPLVTAFIAVIFCISELDAQNSRPKADPEHENSVNCARGLQGCDITALSPDEIKRVSEASRKRN